MSLSVGIYPSFRDDSLATTTSRAAVVVAVAVSTENKKTQQCLGFCGRISEYLNETESFSKCGACPWGQRANEYSICDPCDNLLSAYDWMYLLFVALLPLLMHVQFIRNARKYCRTRIFEIAEHFCSVLENIIACSVSVLIFPPRFTFLLSGCEKSNLKEWYPSSFNPIMDYTKSMRCSYEVVFPLYSLPFLHNLVLMIAIFALRTPLYCTLLYKTYNGKPFYYALLSLPLLAGFHAFLAGLIYYSFPWILLIGSIFALVYHLAKEGKRTIYEMIIRLIKSPLHICFVLITMLLLSFALIAIVISLRGIPNRWMLLWLVPAPLVAYFLTMPFSHPSTVSHSQ